LKSLPDGDRPAAARADLVFVSYSQADRATAYELVAYLETRGIRCWIAPRDITPAAEWAAEIVAAIGAAKILVLVFSSGSNRSPQVCREVERAVHKRVPVISFRIEDVMPEQSLEYFLSSQHWLDAFPAPGENHYATLHDSLRRVLDPHPSAPMRMPAPGPGPAPAPVPSSAAGGRLAPAWTAGDLQGLRRELARYLGPIAEVLVQRAAAQATDIAELRQSLASELDTEPERREFLARVG
jgi:hypothetical protein